MTRNRNSSGNLSKSLFLRGLQCHKSLYLHKYHPELKDETSESREALFQAGHVVGNYAKCLFSGGVEIPYDGLTHEEQLKLTQSLIKKGTSTLYEATFSHDGIFIKADILHRNKKGWDLYEVKSSSEVKDYHYEDVAVQYYVLKGCGLSVSKAFVVHLNKEYVRNGDIDVQKLFTITDVAGEVELRQKTIKDDIKKMRQALIGEVPDIDLGKYCEKPFPCDFKGHCWSHIPENSVFDLREKGVNKYDLYRQRIVRFKQIPLETLNKKQRMQVEYALKKKSHVNADNIKEFLDSLWYPLYFLDFETFMSPIPLYDMSSPNQQMPFQYSLHWYEKKGGKLKHSEYLAQPNIDPRPELLKKLLSEIPADACVIVYKQSFEKGVLKELAELMPEYREQIMAITENVRDLMVPFQRRDYYHWQMQGSYSIKYVLPVLVPGLSYDSMEIANGGMAMNAYSKMCSTSNATEIKQIQKALLEYCKLDTLAMVRIVEKLRKM